jgi:hypothetical protein
VIQESLAGTGLVARAPSFSGGRNRNRCEVVDVRVRIIGGQRVQNLKRFFEHLESLLAVALGESNLVQFHQASCLLLKWQGSELASIENS